MSGNPGITVVVEALGTVGILIFGTVVLVFGF